MRRLLSALALSAAALSSAHAQAPVTQPAAARAPAVDPFLWLEDVEGERALAQVRQWNGSSLAKLEGDPRYADLHAKALAIVNATDRIPVPTLRSDRVDNFWQDQANVRGLWRTTTLDSYRTPQPRWEAVFDLDAVAKAAGENWVYKGSDCLEPDQTRCLISLSEGGKDAVEVREFDVAQKAFVEGGLRLPAAKHRFAWRDRDSLFVATDWGPGSLTTSGYPFVVKVVGRGQSLEQAKEVFRGAASDGGYGVYISTLRSPTGQLDGVVFTRPLSTFEFEQHVLTDRGTRRIPLPPKADVRAYQAGQVVFGLDEGWTHGGRTYRPGSLISFSLAELERDPATARANLIREPGPREFIASVAPTRNRLLVSAYENVTGALYGYAFANGRWTAKRFDLPANASVDVVTTRPEDDTAFVSVTSFLQPTTLYQGDAATGRFQAVKQSPARFDAAGLTTQQFEATSKDGTKIPYFIVHRKAMKLDGSNPTLLYAYGGFNVPMTPGYSGIIGKLWLERGGVYVLANIRGGGEFGPGWHQAGLKENRQRVYDDFAAVARDLTARKITSPRRLGVMGGSNGGLLTGVAVTQTPELYNAAVIQVPLLDMLRYHQLPPGASWMGEYGDPDVPAEAAFIGRYSPYQNLRGGRAMPEVFINTSTKDDRVHPGHARKFAAKMEQLGLPFYYFENIDGGHGGAANLLETARRNALEFTYLTRKLMD
jgi:prolyl oligopeptidase